MTRKKTLKKNILKFAVGLLVAILCLCCINAVQASGIEKLGLYKAKDANGKSYGLEQKLTKIDALEDALDALEADNAFLTEGGVFPAELIANFIKTKREECRQLSAIPHPAEFDKYYNL